MGRLPRAGLSLPIGMAARRAQYRLPEGAAGRRRVQAAEEALCVWARAKVLPFPPTDAFSHRMPLNRAQQRTLEVGSWVVLSGLGFGFQFGSWPVWNFLAGIALYVAWVVLYAEITVRMTRPTSRVVEPSR